LCPPTQEIQSFRQKLTKIIDEENFLKSEIYNADETGLFWHSLPENTEAHRHEILTPGRKEK
jgi:hypothetical protein